MHMRGTTRLGLAGFVAIALGTAGCFFPVEPQAELDITLDNPFAECTPTVCAGSGTYRVTNVGTAPTSTGVTVTSNRSTFDLSCATAGVLDPGESCTGQYTAINQVEPLLPLEVEFTATSGDLSRTENFVLLQ
jgi:hypothetical protein